MSSSSFLIQRLRFLVVTAGLLLGVVGASWGLSAALMTTAAAIVTPGPPSVAELVTGGSAATSLLLLLWLTGTLLISVLGAVPGRIGTRAARLRDRFAPAAVRRWGTLLLGVSLVSTIAPGGAAAAPTAAARSIDDGSSASSQVGPAPVWVPEADPAPAPEWIPIPVRSHPPVSLTAPRQSPAEESTREVVVRRGDTLWDLAAAYLPQEATDAEIAAEWQRWYAANRAVIGADPDLILPGQVLHIPVSETVTTGGSP